MEKGMYMVLIVAVVAVVSLVILTTNTGKVSVQTLSDADLAGMATGGNRPTTSGGSSNNDRTCEEKAQAVKDVCMSHCETVNNCAKYLREFQGLGGRLVEIVTRQNIGVSYATCMQQRSDCYAGCSEDYSVNIGECSED